MELLRGSNFYVRKKKADRCKSKTTGFEYQCYLYDLEQSILPLTYFLEGNNQTLTEILT